MPKFIIETVSIHRLRYAVEADDSDFAIHEFNARLFNAAHNAFDDDLKELGQKHVGEYVTSHRKATDDEIVEVFFQDNSYLREHPEKWNKEHILANFVLNTEED